MNEGYIRHTSSKQRDDAIFTQSVSVTAQQSSAKDPITALNTLVTDQIKTPSTISNPGQYNVSADKGQTSANIQQNQNTVGGLNQQATQNRAAITQAVTQLQRDVYAAAKAANVNAGDLSPNSGAGMALATHAALAATGAGALATIVVSAVEVMGHKEKVSPSVIESRIQDKMLSAGHQQSQSAFTTNASQPLKPFKADYQAYFNAGGTVKQILDMNPNNPHQLPAWKKASGDEHKVKQVGGDLEVADEKKFDTFNPEEINLQLKAGNTKAVEKMLEPVTAHQAHDAVYSLQGMSDLKGLKVASTDAPNPLSPAFNMKAPQTAPAFSA